MSVFSKTELVVLTALSEGKSLKKLGDSAHISEAKIDETVDQLKAKLGGERAADLPERFANVTGWTGKPSEYA